MLRSTMASGSGANIKSRKLTVWPAWRMEAETMANPKGIVGMFIFSVLAEIRRIRIE